MRQTLLVALGLSVALAVPPAGASTPNTGPKPWSDSFPADGPVPTAMTDHLKCVITEVLDDRVVKVWNEASRSEHLVRFAEPVPIVPRKKRDFGDRETLAFEDLSIGHRVKVSYLTGDGTIVGVKVLGKVKRLPGPSLD